jgi:hypothetical protein
MEQLERFNAEQQIASFERQSAMTSENKNGAKMQMVPTKVPT